MTEEKRSGWSIDHDEQTPPPDSAAVAAAYRRADDMAEPPPYYYEAAEVALAMVQKLIRQDSPAGDALRARLGFRWVINIRRDTRPKGLRGLVSDEWEPAP